MDVKLKPVTEKGPWERRKATPEEYQKLLKENADRTHGLLDKMANFLKFWQECPAPACNRARKCCKSTVNYPNEGLWFAGCLGAGPCIVANWPVVQAVHQELERQEKLEPGGQG